MHVVEVGIDMVAQAIIVVGVHNVSDTAFHIVVVNVAPSDRHTVHSHDAASCLVLIAEGVWQTQHCLHITLGMQSL